MIIRHKFYLPIGYVNLPTAPTSAQQGDTYYDSTLKKVRTWNGTKWVSAGGTLTAGSGLTGGGTTTDDIAINVGAGSGIKVGTDSISLDTAVTDRLYVAKTGDTMTGKLALPAANPVNAVDAAHKGYVDAGDNRVNAYSIIAGNGLDGGGPIASNPTVSVKAGTGVVLSNDTVALDTTYADNRYALKAHTHTGYAISTHNHDTVYAKVSHTHSKAQVGLYVTNAIVGNITGNTTVKKTITHNLGSAKAIIGIVATGTSDDGDTMSIAASVQSWNTTSCVILVRNLNASTQENDVRVTVCIFHNP